MASSPPGSKKRASSSSATNDNEASAATSTSAAPTRTASTSNKRVKRSNSNSSNQQGQNVRVVARVRPLSTKEINESSKEAIGVVPSLGLGDPSTSISVTGGRNTNSTSQPKIFDYDGSFGPNTGNSEFYQHAVGNMVTDNIYKGFNVTIMAYGQTGSGKTFTMGTEGGGATSDEEMADATNTKEPATLEPPTESDGVIPRAVYDLFEYRHSMPQGTERVTIELSYLEIYNEEARDLFAEGDNPPPLQIRESPTEGVKVQNLSTKVVTSPQQVRALMNQAAGRRATASTAMNAVSSRSHAICTLHVTIAPSTTATSTDDNNDEEDDTAISSAGMKAKLTLVDLAGSERIKRTGAEGNRRKEGININKGLFVLGQCVSALSELGQKGKAPSSAFVPYRDSKLTRLLQDSLGGNSRTVMVACISPADTNLEESTNTLRYAQSTRNIQNSAVRNVVSSQTMTAAEATALKRENETLKLQLAKAYEKLRAKPAVSTAAAAAAAVQPTQPSNATAVPVEVASNDSSASLPTVSHEAAAKKTTTVSGMDLSKLEKIQQLQSTISSLESKLDIMETQQQSFADDALEASFRADKWQARYEKVMSAAKAKGVSIDADNTNSSSSDTDDSSGSADYVDAAMDLVSQLRNQIASLKSDLHEALADAAMARATAAAVIANNGDLDMTQNMDHGSDSAPPSPQQDVETEEEKQAKVALSEELAAISGGIEKKEAMAMQMYKERECMEAMRCHFESAVKSLNDEVDDLSRQRSSLLDKVGSKNPDGSGKSSTDDNSEDAKKMKKKISELESRIKDLKQKAAEHKKSLRLREAAEKKCEQLANEIQADKKKRVNLQKQLKEAATERRSEKLAAKKEAAKLLRDSNKLKQELQKVKDAAGKQITVLRRKATEALNKQKREAELIAKKQKLQEERKLMTALKANAKAGQHTKSDPSAPEPVPRSTTTIDEDRQAKLNTWLEHEIEVGSAFAKIQAQIQEQKQLLGNASARKIEVQKKQRFSRSSGNMTVTDSKELQEIDDEMDMRGEALEHLHQQLKEIAAESSSAPGVPTSGRPRDPIAILNSSQLEGLSQPEAKNVFVKCFQRVLELRNELDEAEESRERSTTRAVNSALARERRRHEEAIVQLKMDHSQAMMDLLNSTKGSIEHSVRLNSINSVVDDDFKATVEQMMSGYLDGCHKVNEGIQGELRDVKQVHDGMKHMVESVATGMIDNNNSTSTKKKKKKPKHRTSTSSLEEQLALIDDAAEEVEDNSDADSDWSPNKCKTPCPKRRNRKAADSAASKRTSNATKMDTSMETSQLDTTMETVDEDTLQHTSATKMVFECLEEPTRVVQTTAKKTESDSVLITSTHPPKEVEDGIAEPVVVPVPPAKDGMESDTASKSTEENGMDDKSESEAKPAAENRLVESLLQDHYEKLLKKDLIDMLRARGLTVSGNKSELITRLRQHDTELAGSGGAVDLTGGNTDDESEEPAPTDRRGSTRNSRGRNVLQTRDANKPTDAGKKATSKIVLPDTPPQSTHKGGSWSTKKTLSVRRSTVFNKRNLSPMGSDQESPAVDKENSHQNKPAAKGKGLRKAQRTNRNLGSQFNNSTGNAAAVSQRGLELEREMNYLP